MVYIIKCLWYKYLFMLIRFYSTVHIVKCWRKLFYHCFLEVNKKFNTCWSKPGCKIRILDHCSGSGSVTMMKIRADPGSWALIETSFENVTTGDTVLYQNFTNIPECYVIFVLIRPISDFHGILQNKTIIPKKNLTSMKVKRHLGCVMSYFVFKHVIQLDM
jgi:hypothetical protein